MRKVSKFIGMKNKNIPSFSESIIKSKISVQNNELSDFDLNSSQLLKLIKFGYEPKNSVYPAFIDKNLIDF